MEKVTVNGHDYEIVNWPKDEIDRFLEELDSVMSDVDSLIYKVQYSSFNGLNKDVIDEIRKAYNILEDLHTGIDNGNVPVRVPKRVDSHTKSASVVKKEDIKSGMSELLNKSHN